MPFLKALTIAGSDSSGGAGIQADLKTFAALGIYGTSAITAVTAQNFLRIDALTCLPASLVVSQIRSVLSDIGVEAIKTGMLGSPDIIQGVASSLSRYPGIPLVVDPVMAATSGSVLLEEGSLKVLRRQLLPPGTDCHSQSAGSRGAGREPIEGRIRLHPRRPGNPCDGSSVGRAERRPSAGYRVAPGGRAAGGRPGLRRQPRAQGQGPYLQGGPKRGTGCTLSAAIAAFLAKGRSELEAVREAREYLSRSWRYSGESGQAGDPLHHFHAFRPKSGDG